MRNDREIQRRIARQKARKRRRRRRIQQRLLVLVLMAGILCFCLVSLVRFLYGRMEVPAVHYEKTEHPAWSEDFLTVSEYARPGEPLKRVKDIFVHYTANPGTNAVQNRSYFEQLKDTHERSASAHFIIGYEGDIIQCIPLDEIGYAVKTRNEDSISIECCYMNEDGSFTQETYDALLSLLEWLVREYGLTTDNILRHYDCGGKKCPLYYVENEDAWEQLKRDVQERLLSD